MIKRYTLKFFIFLMFCLDGSILSAQINTPAGAVVPFGSNTSYGNGIMPTNLPSSGTYGKANDAANAYIEWKANYVVSCGGSPNQYRVKFDDPSRTVSEGIAYGMLLSAYAADQDLFNGLWAYYKAHSNGNGFMNWRIDGCSGTSGSNGATDADLDAAFALLVAKNQWPSATSPYTYGTEATNLINKLKQYEIQSGSGQAINGDGWGFGNTCRNPSYQSPAYYKAFAAHVLADAAFWNGAVTGAYNLLNTNAHATTGLVSDWCDNNGNRNTCNSGGTGQPATDGYGYDACRNPLRLAQEVLWNNTSNANTILTKVAAYVNGKTATGIRGPIYQDGNLYSGNAHNATFTSTFAVAVMGSSSTYQTLMNSMYTETVNVKDMIQNQTLSGYFGNTLRCLSLFVMTGNFWKIGTTSLQEINVSASAANVPNNSTFDFANVIQTGNKVVTFTITNSGFGTLNLSGATKVAVSGTNAAQFVVTAQPASSSLALNTSTTFTVTFTPGSTGAKTATLTIANNDPDENPYIILLTGAGTVSSTAPKISVSQAGTAIANNNATAFNLGNTTALSSNVKAFTISNTGDNVMNITSITPSGTNYSVLAPIPTTIADGATATIWVKYTSTATTGTFTGSFTIANDDVTNPSYKVNLTTTVVNCAGVSSSDNIQDWDANYTNSSNVDTWNTRWVDNTINPFVDNTNSSYYVAKYTRAAAATQYDGVKYKLCGTNSLGVTASKYIVSMLIYSPNAGTPVLMNLKTAADVANTTTYPSRSSVTVNTTKSGQWERIYFDHSAAISVASINHVEIMIDPLCVKGAALVYYVDDIKLDVAPCLADVPASGILMDYDNHRNMSFPFNPGDAYTDPYTNPSVVAPNTTAKCMQWIRNAPTGTPATDNYRLIRYKICGSYLDLNTAYGSMISMAVYSPKAGIPVLMSLKNGSTGSPTEVAAMTVKTAKANAWEILVFDFTAVKTSTLVKAVDIFIDPLSTNVASMAARTYLIDEIKLTNTLPCVANISSSRILNDFDANRNVDLAFAPTGTWNDVTANPSATGINTSATVAAYGRPAAATADVIRFAACGTNFDLGAGKTLLSFMIYSPIAGVPVTLSCKDATGTNSLLDVNVTTSALINGWQLLTFDCSSLLNSTSVKYLDILIDPAGTKGAKTYYLDNVQYSNLPRMSVFYGPSIITNGTAAVFDMGKISTGSSSSTLTFTIKNTGLNDLNLTGTPKIAISGTNATEFTIDQSLTVSPVTGGSATSFTITFSPTSAGAKTATISIANNDGSANPYTFPISGTGLSPEINIKQSATNIVSGTGSYSFGSLTVGTTSSVITFTIENFGDDTLRLTGVPIVAISGTNAGDFTIVQTSTKAKVDTANATQTTTFTISFTPSATGTRSAMISIVNNDTNENPYTFDLSGTGTCTTPATPDAITGSASPCKSTATTYSITAVAGATSYTWTLPGGWTGTSTTNSISATPNATAGDVRVTASNSCATSTASSLAVTPITTPATPGTISGTTTVCSGSSNTYSIVDVATAASYIWTKPTGWTGTSTTSSLTAVASTTAGNITVKAKNACGTSTAKSLAVTISGSMGTPGAISGSTTPCQGTATTYSITAVIGATSYTWTMPGGWTGTSTTNSISATPDATAGDISVVANGSCGTSGSSSLTITPSAIPATPGTITGSASPCQGTATTYSITAVAGATSYAWTLPGGWTGTSTTNSVSATPNTTAGDITVAASNGCGISGSASFSITPDNGAGNAGTITGPSSICNGATGQTFSITAVAGATDYSWSLPAGASITLGDHTNGIKVTWGSSGGAVTVTPLSACGNGSVSSGHSVTLQVAGCTAPATQTITGPTSVSEGQTNVTYSVSSAASGSTYHWSLPPGSTITSANADSSSIVVTIGSTSGNVVLTETNAAGSTDNTLPINVNVTGIASKQLSYGVEVSPNPSSGLFKVDLSNLNVTTTLKVSNVHGEVVYADDISKTSNTSDYSLDLQSLPGGVYILEIATENGVAIKRIVKQ